MPILPGSRVLRKGRRSLPGQVYLLTCTTAERHPYFADPAIAMPVCKVIRSTLAWGDASLLCWVLMPDHWHGLLQLAQDDVSLVMNRFKSLSSKGLSRTTSVSRSVWTRGFHDRALRHDENLLATARCVVANPVRAGLTRNVRDYPYWDAVWAGGLKEP